MFGTQIHFSTFCFIVLQGVIFIPALVSWLMNFKEDHRARYVILVFLFFSYNLASGLIPDEKLGINRTSQDIIAYSIGISCALFFLFYLFKDFKIKPVKHLKIQLILQILGGNFLILFIIPYTITQDLNTSRNLFLIVPTIIGILALINLFRVFIIDFKKEKSNYYKARIFTGAVGILSLLSLPLTILILGDNQAVEHTLFNIGFVMVSISYVLRMKYISSIETQIKDDLNESFSEHQEIQLSDREKEIIFSLMSSSERISNEDLVEKYLGEDKVTHLKTRLYLILSYLDKKELLPGLSTNRLTHNFKKFNLTEKEVEIAELILEGKKYKEIAESICITEKTVSKHASNIFKKLGVSKRTEFEKMMFEK